MPYRSTLICAFYFFVFNLSFSVAKKFNNGFEIKFGFTGKDLINVTYITLIGAFGMAPTGITGRCKTKNA